MIVRRRTLLLASLTTLVQSYVVPHSRITPVKYRAATEEETAPKPDEIVLGAPFDVAEYPINTDECGAEQEINFDRRDDVDAAARESTRLVSRRPFDAGSSTPTRSGRRPRTTKLMETTRGATSRPL